MSSEKELAKRHSQRMQRKKELIDTAISRADEERGFVVVLTGNGKSSAAGEQRFFQDHNRVEYHVMGTGFTWECQDREKDTD